MSDFSKKLILKLVENADSENVFFMEKYMKNQFRFLGIKQVIRRNIFKNFIKEYGLPDKAHFETLIKELFGNDFRESQYCGMELMKKMKKYWDVKSIDLIEYLKSLGGIPLILFPCTLQGPIFKCFQRKYHCALNVG